MSRFRIFRYFFLEGAAGEGRIKTKWCAPLGPTPPSAIKEPLWLELKPVPTALREFQKSLQSCEEIQILPSWWTQGTVFSYLTGNSTQDLNCVRGTMAPWRMLKSWPSFTLINNMYCVARSPTPGLGRLRQSRFMGREQKGKTKKWDKLSQMKWRKREIWI